MGKQQSDLDKLYGAVSANFDIGSFEEFSTKMQTPEDRKRFYDAVSEHGFDLGDYDSYERRLGGAAEVSSQGSQDTSQTSGQPSGSSEEPSSVDLSDKRSYDKYTDRATYTDVPEQLEARQGVNLGDGVRGISAVDPSSGEVYNVIPEVEVTAPIPFSTNFKNTWENVKTQLQGVDDRLSLVSADTWENLLGKELAQAWYKNVGDRNIDEVRAEAYAELQRLEESIRPVSSIGGSIARGDLIGALSGVINSVAQLGTTALIAVPTAGAGLYTEMVGQSIYDFNKEKSEQLGLSIDELYNQGKAEFATPTFIGILGGSLERIGFRGARQAITAAIRSGVGKRLLKVGLGTQKEGLTELLQYGLEETNRTLADPDASLDDAASSFVQAITSKNGLEAYLMGVAGSAAAAGMGGIGSKLIGRDNRAAVEEAGTTIAALNEDLNNPELPANTRAVLEGEQQAAVDQVVEAINNDVAIESSLTPDQQNRINDLTNRLDELQTVVSDPAVSDGTREIFESEIESVRAEIDAIVSEPPSQKTADATQPIEATSQETVIEEAGEPISSLIDTEVDYNGERGMLIQDGQQLVVRLPRNEEGIVREIEVGNIEELGQTPANEIGIEPAVSEVSVNDAGNFTVRGREYVNTQRNPLSAIKYNEEGQITSVVLRTPEGQQRTFRGRAADDIAYEIHLQEIERNNETATRFEDFINQPEISTEIDNAGLSEITEGETAAIIEPVQPTEQQTIEDGQSRTNDNLVQKRTRPKQGLNRETETDTQEKIFNRRVKATDAWLKALEKNNTEAGRNAATELYRESILEETERPEIVLDDNDIRGKEIRAQSSDGTIIGPETIKDGTRSPQEPRYAGQQARKSRANERIGAHKTSQQGELGEIQRQDYSLNQVERGQVVSALREMFDVSDNRIKARGARNLRQMLSEKVSEPLQQSEIIDLITNYLDNGPFSQRKTKKIPLGSTSGDSTQMDQVVREQTTPEEGQGQETQTQEIVNEAEQSPIAENDAAQVQQPPIEEATTDIPQPTQRTRAPKGLLKGVSDRLKQTGLATGITVTNSEAITQSLGVDGNNVNGYVDNDGNIVINSDRASVDTPIHELSHVWEQTVERDNPALHTRGMELIQTAEGNPYVEYVRQTQPTLEGPALFKEALAQAIGDRGARLIDSQKQSTLKEWLKRAWEYIGGLVGISGLTADQISNLTLGQYADAVAVDLLSGKPYAKLNNGDIVAKTPAATEQQMDESDRFMADFMTRMKKRNGVNFQASIDGSLSPQDFNDLITFFRYARQKNQIAGIEDARAAATAMGINSPAQVDMAFALSKVEGRESTGFKKGEVSAETLNNANYAGMSDAEYRDLGRQLVESGQVNPENLVAEIIREPRALQPWEVTALQFHRTQIESQIFEAQELLESGKEADINKFTFQGITGYKGIAAKMEVINSALFDMEVAMLATANQQSAAFRLRSLMADKDFNVVQYLAEMKARGYVDPQLEAKLKSLSAELNSVRAKLKRKSEEAERLAEQIAQGNIVQAASQPQRTTNRVRTKKATVDALNMVLDAIDVSSFALPGMRFQANNTIRFQVSPNDAVSAAVNDAITEMKVNVSEGRLSVSDAIEKAVADIDAAVGKNNWDSMKFRSTIANQMVQQSIPLKIKKPYVNSDGVLIVPGEYLKSLAQNGQDTIDKMVAAASAELGGSFSEYDIRNAISGYGRQSGEHRTDLQRKIAKARRVANLLSQIEDLETKGKSLKTNKQRHNNDTEINNLREQVRQLEYELEMTPEERAQLAEQRYHDQRHKYLRNYIDQVQDRINNKDFAPVKHVNRYEDDAETRQLRAEAEKIKNEFKKEKYRHELENRTKWEKWRSLGYDIIFNIIRGLSAGADLSALGVQGAIFSAARPRQAAKVLIGSMPGTFSEETYEQYFADMQADPFYEMARKAGLNLQLPNFYQSVQEEQYKGTLPTLMMDFLVGKTARGIATVTGRDADRAEAFATDKLNPFKVGDRNYSLVLSQIRLDLFKEFMTNQINKSGVNTQIDDATVKQVAEVVNTITMASKVPGLQGKLANDIISAIMFSARKFVATWKILGGWAPLIMGPKRNPQLFYDAYGRVIGKGLGTMFLAAALPAAIASWMKAADDEEDEEEDPYFYNPYFLDPRHSDFLKIKAGDTRISLFQGIDGNVVFATRMATKEYMTSSSQAVRPLNGEGFNKTRLELSWDYISNKFAPTASIVTRGLQGDREQQEAYERFQESLGPMWLTGVKEQYDNTGNLLETGTLGVLGILGLSYNNYGGAEFAQKRGTNNQKAQAIFDRSGLTAYDPASGQRTYFDGKEVVKATGDVYKKKYLPAYQKFMTEAVVSNEKKLDRGVNWEIKEGLVKKFKSEAYKYAEIKTSGVYAKGNYNSFSSDGTEYRLLESQYPLKAKYINQYMSREAKRERSSAKREVMQKLRSDGIKPTDGYRDMLIDLYLYNKANSYANEKLISDMNRKKIKLIKKADYTSDMEEAEPETE